MLLSKQALVHNGSSETLGELHLTTFNSKRVLKEEQDPRCCGTIGLVIPP